MKAFALILCAAFLLSSSPVVASDINPPLSERQAALVRTNILAGLDHPSVEVRAGYIQLVIDLKKAWPNANFDYAIIPLMGKLKSDTRPEVRILAALALFEYDSNLGRFAVSRRAMYDESDRVARHCSTLARSWQRERGAATPLDLVASLFR